MKDPHEKMTFAVSACRLDEHGSRSHCKSASLILDTDLGGPMDAFNPAELLMAALAALAACMIKGIERVTPILKFRLRGVNVQIQGVRQDVPPRMESMDYVIPVDTDEPEHPLELLHENVRRSGTVFNTVAPGTLLSGVMQRAELSGSQD